jgi:hypothetical protein
MLLLVPQILAACVYKLSACAVSIPSVNTVMHTHTLNNAQRNANSAQQCCASKHTCKDFVPPKLALHDVFALLCSAAAAQR